MKARTLIDGLVNPAPSDIDAVVALIWKGRSAPRADLNRKLAPYRVQVEHHPMFAEYPGAGGGAAGDGTVYLNPLAVFNQSYSGLKLLVTHELVHSGQRQRIKHGDLDQIERNDMAKLRKLGVQRYYRKEPLEAMALARNAYDAMLDAGVDIEAALRSGKAARYSPVPLGQYHRLFDKYLYAYWAAGNSQVQAPE